MIKSKRAEWGFGEKCAVLGSIRRIQVGGERKLGQLSCRGQHEGPDGQVSHTPQSTPQRVVYGSFLVMFEGHRERLGLIKS
jgi:hypothetical protein